MRPTAFRVSGLICAAIVLACGSDTPTDTGTGLEGSYNATQWSTTGTSGQTNQLLAGSTLNITLNANHTTTGHMHVTAQGNDPAFDADMAGTWAKDGNTVSFSQGADTFVRDMDFTVAPASSTRWSLVGDHVFSGTRVQISLTQAPLID